MIRICVPDNILEIFSHISLSDISGCSTVSRRSQFEAWSRFDSFAPDLRVSLQSLSLPHLHTCHKTAAMNKRNARTDNRDTDTTVEEDSGPSQLLQSPELEQLQS